MSKMIMTSDELLVTINGEDLDEYRAEKTIRMRISEEAQKYIDSPSTDWPEIAFNWDYSAEAQRYSLDGISKSDFEKDYPEGFCLGIVDLEEFDKIICHYSRRDEGELWEIGRKDSLAYLIVYLSENRKISPPIVILLNTGKLGFIGGHHRYAIARELKVKQIPIYVAPESKRAINERLNVEWENP